MDRGAVIDRDPVCPSLDRPLIHHDLEAGTDRARQHPDTRSTNRRRTDQNQQHSGEHKKRFHPPSIAHPAYRRTPIASPPTDEAPRGDIPERKRRPSTNTNPSGGSGAIEPAAASGLTSQFLGAADELRGFDRERLGDQVDAFECWVQFGPFDLTHVVSVESSQLPELFLRDSPLFA